MKNLYSVLVLQVFLTLSLNAQPVSDYSYKFDNGIIVKTDRCWNHVWVQQSYEPVKTGEQIPQLSVNIRTLGDLITSSAFKLMSAGKEVKTQGAAPGTYNLKLNFKLSGKPGNLSFIVENIVLKAKTKTSVSVTLYDYQILIDETPASLKGLSSYESKINRYKGNTEQHLNPGIPSFYAKGKRDKPIPPDETLGETNGKIKPGTYDVLISIAISGQIQRVWLENFVLKHDVNYKITTNLNGGVIVYTGGNKDVKVMHLYPAGTAGSQTGNPAPVKNLEIIKYESITSTNACPPGSYDILLELGRGGKYEWRKNITVKTGAKTEVK